MPSSPMRRIAVRAIPGRAVLLVLMAILVGVGVPAASPPVADAASCPDPGSVSFAQLWRLWRADARPGDGGGSGDWRAARRCFGSTPFTIHAYVARVEGIGGTSLTGVAPAYWEWPDLYLMGSRRTRAYGFDYGRYLGIVVPSGWPNLTRMYHGSWAYVTVRFNHPRATECMGYGPKKDGRPTKQQAVAICRRQPVILSISRAGPLPATDTLPGPATPAGPPAGSPHPVSLVC